jgi:hypothetical protein
MFYSTLLYQIIELFRVPGRLECVDNQASQMTAAASATKEANLSASLS